MTTTKTFSLYLGKEAVGSPDELLTVAARDLVQRGVAHRVTSQGFGEESALFTFPGQRITPKWVGHLAPTFEVPGNLVSQSPCAVVAFKKDGRYFAITFSYGHVYLDDAKTESEFGLKVAINTLSDEKLRSVEHSNIGDAIRGFSQAAGRRDLKSFGFDEALDLIRKVSGYADDDDFADMVTGARALRFSKKMELGEVPDTASDALTLFGQNAYKSTAFKIIDFLSPVLDPELIAVLDGLLLTAIAGDSDDFEVAIPEILQGGVGSFAFVGAGIRGAHPDLSVDLYREGLGDNLAGLTVEDLKKHKVAAFSEAGERVDQWSVRHALVGTVMLGETRYALNEGVWYRLDQQYKNAADRKFADLVSDPDPVFTPLAKLYPPRVRGQPQKPHYQSEESYNAGVAARSGYLLLDRKLIDIPDVPGPGVEACDLLDIAGRRFIHVKKSSRQSSVLSHFFKQGANSAQMLRQYEPFRTNLVQRVAALYGEEPAQQLSAALGDRWTVEFQIADFPRRDGSFNIPFFSKLTLRDEARSMEAMQFDVAVKFIRLAGPG